MLNFRDDSDGRTKRVSMNMGAAVKRDVAAEARKQREVREQARLANVAAARIQALVRAALSRARARDQVRAVFTKQVGDLQRVIAVLRAQNKAPFTPPEPVMHMLLREWLFGWPTKSPQSEAYRVVLAELLPPSFRRSDILLGRFVARCVDDALDAVTVHKLVIDAPDAFKARVLPIVMRLASTRLSLHSRELVRGCLVAAESCGDVASVRAAYQEINPECDEAELGAAFAALPLAARRFFYAACVDNVQPRRHTCDVLAYSYSYAANDASGLAFAHLLLRSVGDMSAATVHWLVKNHIGDVLALPDGVAVAALLNQLCDAWIKPLAAGELSPRALILLEAVRKGDKPAPAVCALWNALVATWNPLRSATDATWRAACEFTASATSLLMQALDDDEMFRRQTPFALPALEEIATMLKAFLYQITWQRDAEAPQSIVVFFCELNARFERHPDLGLPADFWHFTALPPRELGVGPTPSSAPRRMRDASVQGGEDAMELEDDDDDGTVATRARGVAEEQLTAQVTPRGKRVLRVLPMCVPFASRVQLFYQFLSQFKHDAMQVMREFEDPRTRVHAEVHRDSVVADAFEQLENADLRGRVRINFVSALGLDEAGIDGGGLFKEFVGLFCAEAFRPARGLFVPNADGKLSPHPSANPRMLKFVGRVLAKAVFDGILVEPELAPWVLNLMAGSRNTLHDLVTLDAQAYHGLMQLKTLPAEAFNDLGLFFTAVNSTTGREVELVPGGAQLAVTRANFAKYASEFANFRLNVELLPQVSALAEGFHTLVAPTWVRMFSPAEFQSLIGGTDRDISIADLRAHTVYAGGYWATDEYIAMFWSVVKDDLTPRQRGALLRFVTSCSRPPLTGFGSLDPPFTICKLNEGVQRLPSASTCVNMLRLPKYPTREALRDKLVTAIESGAGFELT